MQFVESALPYVVMIATAIFAGVVHLKNRRLQKAKFHLAKKLDDMTNAEVEGDIADIEAKVATDDEERLRLQAAITDFDSDDDSGTR